MPIITPGPVDPRVDAVGAFQTMDRVLFGSGIAITTTRRYLMFFTGLSGKTFSTLTLTTGAGAPSGVTAGRMGLYTVASNGDCSLVCQTSNDGTIGAAASTAYPKTLDTTGGFPASYTIVPGQRYAASFFITATGTPTVFGLATNTLVVSASPRLTGFDNSGSGTDLNPTVTNANIGNIASQFYLCGT